MSIKFLRSAANQYLSVPDSVGLTFPNSDWSIGFTMAFDGLTSGDNPQYLFSTGPYQSAGSLEIIYQTVQNGIQVFAETVFTPAGNTTVFGASSGVYLFVVSQNSGTLNIKSCKVRTTAPTDGTGVVLEGSVALGKALDGPSGLFIGGRADLTATRFADQSLARFFYVLGSLTDFEIAKLAYGMEITDIGKAPQWYFKMDTPSDIADRGSLGLTVTPHGSLATGTAPGYGYVAPTPLPIDVAQMIAEKVYQRTGAAAALAMSGTYTGTVPTSIEYQLYAADGATILVPWTAIAGVNISGGTWSGVPLIPIGGPYRNSVRSKSGSTVLATSNIKVNLFLVGGDGYAVGSSSANRWFLNNSGTGFTPNANVRQASSSGWSLFGTDGCAIRMANSMATQGNIPIGMVNCGVEGETLANWLNMSGTSWTSFANTLAANGGKMEFLMVAMGSNDAAQGIVVSRAQHAANLRQFISNVRTLTNQPNLQVVISGFNGRPGVTAQQADFVRMAENDVGGDANVSLVQIVDLPLSSDNIHLSPAGFTTSGDRITYVLGRRMYGDGTYLQGPKETAITYTTNVIKIALQQRNGTDFTPTTGIGGYVFTDNSGALPLTSVVRSSATEITITPSRAIVGIPVGTYLSGSDQAPSNSVMDNGTVPLPMNVETALVATAAGTSTVTSVTVTPTNATVQGGGTVDFDWVVNGTGNPSQAATPATNLGSINSAGVLTAPAATSVVQNGTVTVTSVQDPTKSGTATFSVPAQGTRTITITFGNAEGAYANQTGLSVSFHNETLPHLTTTAAFQSGTETTDGNGTMTFSFASTRNVGDMGLLTVYGPNGIHYDGPWALS